MLNQSRVSWILYRLPHGFYLMLQGLEGAGGDLTNIGMRSDFASCFHDRPCDVDEVWQKPVLSPLCFRSYESHQPLSMRILDCQQPLMQVCDLNNPPPNGVHGYSASELQLPTIPNNKDRTTESFRARSESSLGTCGYKITTFTHRWTRGSFPTLHEKVNVQSSLRRRGSYFVGKGVEIPRPISLDRI
ncbi:hypothetical protein PAAG_06839 [Paracoccidioides lutzii Pb01]|uniref:Uncharacterized protein n=1 Tax=Paracoccidioides lutzii (strain ATCC MYA-826 / Pb01) TaxID=502779 RepID=C1H7U8_PARBA|nr:hypothetical protein PAAG_06839 [Paracoccidioides lutzii Pb01]EEH36421.2 hypothetical protein PAAG_06839 [Paracoccidioides lutzii Pb01]